MSGDNNLENKKDSTNKADNALNGYGYDHPLQGKIKQNVQNNPHNNPAQNYENQFQPGSGVYGYGPGQNPFQAEAYKQQPHFEQQHARPAHQNNNHKQLNTKIEQHHSSQPKHTKNQNHQTWYKVSGQYDYSLPVGNFQERGRLSTWFMNTSIKDGMTINTTIGKERGYNQHFDRIQGVFHKGSDRFGRPYAYIDAKVHRLGTNNDARNWYQVKIPAHINITKPPSNYYR